MKVNKTQSLLFVFNQLLSNGYITKEEIVNALEISSLNFHRYIQELRAFLYNFNLNYSLEYCKSEEKYCLKRILNK